MIFFHLQVTTKIQHFPYTMNGVDEAFYGLTCDIQVEWKTHSKFKISFERHKNKIWIGNPNYATFF